MKNKPTFKEALRFWTKLGFISFGGPAGQISIMHEYLVEKKKWISDSKFLHALNYCMILPGPEAQQLATYIGWMLHGKWGGLVAGILFLLPSMFILLGLSIIYVLYGNVPWIHAIFSGLKPAVIAIVILALVKIGKKSLHSLFHYFVAILAFVSIFFFNVSFPIIIIFTILLSLLLRKIFPQFYSNTKKSEMKTDEDEKDYYINKFTNLDGIGQNYTRIALQILTGILLWIIPLVGIYFLFPEFEFWKTLATFFTQAAFVTFGGAYSVLPYVAQVSVEKFNWLTNLQMIDGLALGETTPGPLIMVLTFVGFMAGYNNFESSLAMGSLGLVVTTFYTFLPCFLFIFIGAPIIERTRDNKLFKDILALVTAAVVGVILNLTIYLGNAIIFPQGFSLAYLDIISLVWIFISLIALIRFQVNMILWIGVSGIFGLVRHIVLSI